MTDMLERHFTEAEAVAYTRHVMATCTDVRAADEEIRQFWIDWTRGVRHPVVVHESGCVDCGATIVRTGRGKLPARCEECRVTPAPMLHYCERCQTQLFRSDGSASGRGRWNALCDPCKASPGQD